MTGDGFVGVDGLNRTIENWNKGRLPVAAATVPEPATAVLLTVLVLGVRRRGVRRGAGNYAPGASGP